jgi:hypothetical protein
MTLEQKVNDLLVRVDRIEKLVRARKSISRAQSPETCLAAADAMVGKLRRLADQLRAEIREKQALNEALNEV